VYASLSLNNDITMDHELRIKYSNPQVIITVYGKFLQETPQVLTKINGLKFKQLGFGQLGPGQLEFRQLV
jgi:hypothetical protein